MMITTRRRFLHTAAVGAVSAKVACAFGWDRVQTGGTSATFTAPDAAYACSDPAGFPYAPAWWQTLICAPDDPDKIFVGREGQLLLDYDYTGSPCSQSMRNFAIALQPDLSTGTTWLGQSILSPRVPIIRTQRAAGALKVSEEIIIDSARMSGTPGLPKLSRVDIAFFIYGQSALLVKAPSNVSPNFKGVAIGEGPIRFRAAVPRGADVTVIFGFCGIFPLPGIRRMLLTADGGGALTVDPVTDFGPKHPGLYRLPAQDANRDGVIEIAVSGVDGGAPVLNALWIFTGTPPSDETIISGHADALADAQFPRIYRPARRTIIAARISNSSIDGLSYQPLLRIRCGPNPSRISQSGGTVQIGEGTSVTASEPLILVAQPTYDEVAATFSERTLAPGETHEVVYTVDRHPAEDSSAVQPSSVPKIRDATVRWWKERDLPYGVIELPDPRVQALVDSCIRTMWQLRELKVEGPAYQAGASRYRGSWILDGAYYAETLAMLGRPEDARAGIEQLLSLQKADGSFELLGRHWKENGIILWIVTRYALLAQNKEWLRQRWPVLVRVMQAIQRLREEASKEPTALNYRLLPAGFADGGGVGGDGTVPEYANVYWMLVGVKAILEAAHWLGEETSARSWVTFYSDIYTVFRAACARDARPDAHGNTYVPVAMADAGHCSPPKGQWAFCCAVHPGRIFPTSDPMVVSQLAMLKAAKLEGMVADSGLMVDGIWTTMASFYGHAQLWNGNGQEAADALLAFAQHASPLHAWREEVEQAGHGPDAYGDMPQGQASAEFLRLAGHLLALDRGEELHLLEGYPRQWSQPGWVTRLKGMLTPFGPLHLEVNVAADGRSARISARQLTGREPRRLILHTGALNGQDEQIELDTRKDVSHVVSLKS